MLWYNRTILAGYYALDNSKWRYVRDRAGQGATKSEVAEELGLKYNHFIDTITRKVNLGEPAWEQVWMQFEQNARDHLSRENKIRLEPDTREMRRDIDWRDVAKKILGGQGIREIARGLEMSHVTLWKRIQRELLNESSPSFNANVAKRLKPAPAVQGPWRQDTTPSKAYAPPISA
jgi:hypothetical protein